MSGRPERLEFVQVLAEKIPYYRQRHAVRPGITGWAQINHKYGDTLEDTIAKLEYAAFLVVVEKALRFGDDASRIRPHQFHLPRFHRVRPLRLVSHHQHRPSATPPPPAPRPSR